MPRISGRPQRSTRSLGTRRTSSTVAPSSPSSSIETNPRTVGASIGASAKSATLLAVELDEEIDRRLALLDPMRGVLVRGQAIGQRGQALGEVEQEVDPLLPVALAHLGGDLVQFGHAWSVVSGQWSVKRIPSVSGPVSSRSAVRQRTRLH